MFKNTKMNLRETSCALDWLTALRGKKKPANPSRKRKQDNTPATNHTPPPAKVTFSSLIKCPNRVMCTLVHHQPLLISSHTYEHPLGAIPLMFGTAERPRCTRSDEWTHGRSEETHTDGTDNSPELLRQTNAWWAGARGTVGKPRAVILHMSGWWSASWALLEPHFTMEC